jgi:hypothetical protein
MAPQIIGQDFKNPGLSPFGDRGSRKRENSGENIEKPIRRYQSARRLLTGFTRAA